MNRRQFLKGTARASLAGLAVLILPTLRANAGPGAPPPTLQAKAGPGAPPPTPAPAYAVKRKFKGTKDGLIFESLDGGSTWQRIANFGQHCSILKIVQQPSQLYTEVGIQGYSFALRSVDGRMWRTVG